MGSGRGGGGGGDDRGCAGEPGGEELHAVPAADREDPGGAAGGAIDGAGGVAALKGECLLQEKNSEAADIFEAAAKAYPDKDVKKTKDGKPGKSTKEAATDAATSELIRKSADWQYTPKTGKDKTALPIVDAAARPAALKALYADDLAADEAQAKPLLTGSPSLPSVVDFAPKLHDLDMVALAVGDDDAAVVKLQKDLAGSAKKHIDAAVTQMNQQTDAASADAGKMLQQTTGTGRNRRTTSKPKGLTDTERSNLGNDLATAGQIPPWLKTLQTALDTDDNYFQQETTNVQSLKTKIQGVLSRYPG